LPLGLLRLSEDKMANIGEALKAVIVRILEGDGHASRAERRAAFDDATPGEPLATLIRKVTKRACEVTDEDVMAVRASGLSEDQVFEIVVCAAVGHANRQYDHALAALEAVAKE
jgi:hypothetical protein